MNDFALFVYYRLEVNTITKMVTIDSSTNRTGIGYYESGTYTTNHLIDASYDKQMDSRFALMSKEILSILDIYNPDIIYIEETVVVRNPQTQRFLTRLQGVIYAWCIQHDCEFNTIRPTEWRKLIGINQGKNIKRDELKKQSIKYVKENYGLKVGDDVADALCIGSAVLKRFGVV